MGKLKPQLIITGSNKKKSGFASGIGHFLILVVVFVLGVYVGMRMDNTDMGGEQFGGVSEDAAPASQNNIVESSNVEVVVDPEIVPESVTKSTANIIEDEIDRTDLRTSTENENNDLDISSSITVDDDSSSPNLNNEFSLVEQNLVDPTSEPEDSYRLQVAAFGNLNDANQLVAELKQKGYDAYIVTSSNSRGEVWNLIKIGNFKTAQEAWNLSTIYQSKEAGEVFVESLNEGRLYKETLKESSEQDRNL
ncbi:MAG: hypothetical protein DHS20C13_14120 [Thermodesulfobacteriota bacterium]|nr:MAG: hypothetical protein DHS20C13_14120 [Thermodesulfobacteriota bacterium]